MSIEEPRVLPHTNLGLGALPGVQLGYGWGTGGVRVGYDLPRISPSGVRVGYGWGTVGVQVGYAGNFSVNRL